MRTLAVAVILAVSLAALVACAGDAGGPPDAGIEFGQLGAYQERCERLALEGAAARVVYAPRQEMTKDESDEVKAAVSIDQRLRTADILTETEEVIEEAEVKVVSCQVQARLTFSSDAFDVDPAGWIERSFLTGETVRWTWLVTPMEGGDQSLVLELRPIVMVDDDALLAADSDVQEYPISIDVAVPIKEQATGVMDDIEDFMLSAKGVLVAFAALLGAVVAVLAAIRSLRRRSAKGNGGTPEDASARGEEGSSGSGAGLP
jgi:hypothetical protein